MLHTPSNLLCNWSKSQQQRNEITVMLGDRSLNELFVVCFCHLRQINIKIQIYVLWEPCKCAILRNSPSNKHKYLLKLYVKFALSVVHNLLLPYPKK